MKKSNGDKKLDGVVFAIVGSREFKDYAKMSEQMERAIDQFGVKPDHVVSGGAPGADQLGERWAREHGILEECVHILTPNWKAVGISAGVQRNTNIVALATHMVAFPSIKGKGTQDAIEKAKKKGIPILEWWCDSVLEISRPLGDTKKKARFTLFSTQDNVVVQKDKTYDGVLDVLGRRDIFQYITSRYLGFRDLVNFSKTCKKLYLKTEDVYPWIVPSRWYGLQICWKFAEAKDKTKFSRDRASINLFFPLFDMISSCDGTRKDQCPRLMQEYVHTVTQVIVFLFAESHTEDMYFSKEDAVESQKIYGRMFDCLAEILVRRGLLAPIYQWINFDATRLNIRNKIRGVLNSAILDTVKNENVNPPDHDVVFQHWINELNKKKVEGAKLGILYISDLFDDIFASWHHSFIKLLELAGVIDEHQRFNDGDLFAMAMQAATSSFTTEGLEFLRQDMDVTLQSLENMILSCIKDCWPSSDNSYNDILTSLKTLETCEYINQMIKDQYFDSQQMWFGETIGKEQQSKDRLVYLESLANCIRSCHHKIGANTDFADHSKYDMCNWYGSRVQLASEQLCLYMVHEYISKIMDCIYEIAWYFDPIVFVNLYPDCMYLCQDAKDGLNKYFTGNVPKFDPGVNSRKDGTLTFSLTSDQKLRQQAMLAPIVDDTAPKKRVVRKRQRKVN